jgi:hypothetical protein
LELRLGLERNSKRQGVTSQGVPTGLACSVTFVYAIAI